MSISVTAKDLLDAGVHFGHQTKRWNPRSKPYVFDHRQGISIIDLGKTHSALEKACAFLTETVANGGVVLFVGTKRQAQDIIREAATATNMPFCVDRWLGGTLTNFQTVTRSIAKFKKYQQMETSGELDKLPSKEVAAIKREMTRMTRNFNGIVDMGSLPVTYSLRIPFLVAARGGKQRVNLPGGKTLDIDIPEMNATLSATVDAWFERASKAA